MASFDRTRVAVSRQLSGMDCDLYDVGVRDPKKGMLSRTWSSSKLLESIGWLKTENTRGSHIYVRPAKDAPSRLILVDDVKQGGLTRLKERGFRPAVIVQTSPSNFQAWIKLAEAEPPLVRREAALFLAREFGGDMNSADATHNGRLAGFTNRKPEHADSAGRYPFVLLDSYHGRVAEGSTELVKIATESLERGNAAVELVKHEARRLPRAQTTQASSELLAWCGSLWRSLREICGAEVDPSRLDWSAAVVIFRQGYSYDECVAALQAHSPGLEDRKGPAADDYVLRTAGKAEVWVGLEAAGAMYMDVKDSLLQLAVERAAQRAAGQR